MCVKMKKKKAYKVSLFEKLGIKEDQYPVYRDPEQFARGIRKCSLLKSHEIRYSNTSASQEPFAE
jgi:hypothetical protein